MAYLLLAAFLIAGLYQPARASADGSLIFASVNVAKLQIKKSASLRARTVATLTQGEVVRVTAAQGAWSKVATSAGKEGWCQTGNLGLESNASAFKPSASALLDWPSANINLAQTFTYGRCMQDMQEIAAAYPDRARIETIGTSVMGNPIRAIVLGNPDASVKILVQAAIHAREMISSIVALRQAECMLKAAALDASYRGVKLSALLNSVEVWIVPMSNPDGVRLMYEGLSAVPASMPALAASIKSMNRGRRNFLTWKANANGVDLNRNFDGGWKPDPKVKKPAPLNYPGTAPFTEPESIALRDLTLAKDFALTLSYHSSGNTVYWHDPGSTNGLNQYLANRIRSVNGYRVLPIRSQPLNGGYRDWYVKQYDRPGFTIELGKGYCPLPMSSYGGIWSANRFLLMDMAWTVAPKSLSENVN